MINSLAQILEFAYPGRPFSTVDNKEIICHDDGPVPTDAELQAADELLQKHKDATQYLKDREKDFPPLKDLIEMIWHSMDTGVIVKDNLFYDAIKAVYDKHPAPPQ